MGTRRFFAAARTDLPASPSLARAFQELNLSDIFDHHAYDE
jgi:hypothetical protein